MTNKHGYEKKGSLSLPLLLTKGEVSHTTPREVKETICERVVGKWAREMFRILTARDSAFSSWPPERRCATTARARIYLCTHFPKMKRCIYLM